MTLLLSRVSAVASGESHRVEQWWRVRDGGGRWLAESWLVGSAQSGLAHCWTSTIVS